MLQPIHNYILIEELEYKERVTASWIILAWEKAKNETGKWVVLGIWSEAEGIEVGDIVYFNRYIPQEIIVEDKRYLTLPRKDVQAREVK